MPHVFFAFAYACAVQVVGDLFHNISYCMEYKCIQFSVAIFDTHACSYYIR